MSQTLLLNAHPSILDTNTTKSPPTYPIHLPIHPRPKQLLKTHPPITRQTTLLTFIRLQPYQHVPKRIISWFEN